jgi:hypothetical protein
MGSLNWITIESHYLDWIQYSSNKITKVQVPSMVIKNMATFQKFGFFKVHFGIFANCHIFIFQRAKLIGGIEKTGKDDN